MAKVATVMTPREAPRMGGADIKALAGALARFGARPLDHTWLANGEAFDVFFEGPAPAASFLLDAAGWRERPLDCIIQPAQGRAKRLFVADMDSTIIAEECIDEIAAALDLKAKIAPITEAAMRGELDFRSALLERVALLKGLEREALKTVLDTRIHFNPGAETLIATLKKEGVKTALVSGGFTFFTGPLGSRLSFDLVLSNELVFKGDSLAGTLKEPIVDGQTKRDFLLETAKKEGWSKTETVAIGDGANDIPMFEAAGLSLSYHGKPAADKAATGCLRHADLTGVLYALGLPKTRFAA